MKERKVYDYIVEKMTKLHMTWRYSGHCKKGVWVKENDVDAESPKPFNKDCRNPMFALYKGGTVNCKVKNSK